MNKKVLLTLSTALLLINTVAFADTDTGQLVVSANVAAKCKVVQGGSITFTDYDPTSTDAANADGTIKVRCTKDTDSKIYITGDRKMTSSSTTDELNYELYSDQNHTNVWGDNQTTGVDFKPTSNATVDLPVYGQIAAGQDVAQGNYRATNTVTIEW